MLKTLQFPGGLYLRPIFLIVGLLFVSICHAEKSTELKKLFMANNQFVISFPANPSTGYTWTIVYYDQRRFNLLKSEYVTPDKVKRIGAAGKMMYEFQVRDAGTFPFSSKIKFRYARPWDKNSGVDKTALITVRQPQRKPSVQIQ